MLSHGITRDNHEEIRYFSDLIRSCLVNLKVTITFVIAFFINEWNPRFYSFDGRNFFTYFFSFSSVL